MTRKHTIAASRERGAEINAGMPAATAPATPATAQRVHVVLADADPLARRVVREALEREPDLVVDADATDGIEALEAVRRHRPRLLIIEAELPGILGVEVVRRLATEAPETRAVMLCVYRDDDVALEALQAGADGYLTKEVHPSELPEVVRKVARGEPVVPPSLLPRLLERLRAVPDAGWRPVRSRLTTREWEIVELLEEGASTDQIAAALVVSPSTVYSHVKSLMRKLRVHSRSDAIAVARELRRAETGPGTATHGEDA
jgi:DNA-binding NarL/FixJ family response regulator